MSQTNTDFLLQVIAQTADRAPSTARTGGDSAGFDNHLSQASASVFDVVRPFNRNDTAPSFATSDHRPDRSSYDSPVSDANSRPSDTAKPPIETTCNSTGSPSSSTQPCRNADETENATNDSGDEHRDKDPANEELGTGLAGAAQATAKETTKSDASTTREDERHATKPLKDQAVKEAAESLAQHRARTDKASEEADAKKINAKATLEATTDEQPASEAAAYSEGGIKATDKAKHGELTEAVHAATVAKGAVQSEEPAEKGNTAKDADVPVHAEGKPVSATAKRAAGSAEQDKSSDDDSRRSAKATTLAIDRNDVGAITNNPNKSSVAAVLANIADSSKDGGASKDSSEKVAKQIAAKTESAVGPLGRALRSTIEGTRGGRLTGADETPQVDPARFVGRVAKAFHTAHERGGTLQLRLSPPELGALRIQLTVKDGVMSASLETDNASARRVLLDHLPMLRDRLAEQNIRVDRFDVDVRQENSGGQANPHGSNQHPHQPQPERAEPRRFANAQKRASETELPIPQTAAARMTNNEINLVI